MEPFISEIIRQAWPTQFKNGFRAGRLTITALSDASRETQDNQIRPYYRHELRYLLHSSLSPAKPQNVFSKILDQPA